MKKKDIGQRLRDVREGEFSLSREKFAEKLGLQAHQLRDIETGKVAIPGPLTKLLQCSLGISEQWLLTGQGPMKIEAEQAAPQHQPAPPPSIPDLLKRAELVMEQGGTQAAAIAAAINAAFEATEDTAKLRQLERHRPAPVLEVYDPNIDPMARLIIEWLRSEEDITETATAISLLKDANGFKEFLDRRKAEREKRA